MGFVLPSKSSATMIPFPYNPQSQFSTMFEFGCSLTKSFNGMEQVQSFQSSPKIITTYKFIIKSTNSESVISSLYKPALYIVPLWYQMESSVEEILLGSDSIKVSPTGRDYQMASHVFIYNFISDSSEYIEIDSLDGDILYLKSETLNYYPEGSIISPAFAGVISTEPTSDEYPENGLIELEVSFVIKSRIALNTSFSYTPKYYKGRMVLEFCNKFDDNTSASTYASDFEIIELDSGSLRSFVKYKTPPIIKSWGFRTENYAEVTDLINLFILLKGRQTLIYVPTLRNEFAISEYVPSGANTILVKKGGFKNIFDNSFGARSMMFYTESGIFFRDILSITDYSDTQEQIQLSSGIQYELFPNECHICWLILSRSDSDAFSIEQNTLNNGSCQVNFIEVRDE